MKSMGAGSSIHFENEFNGFHFTIEINENSTQRTKNRIRERGPSFFLVSCADSTFCMSEKVVLLRSTDDMWLGWLPVREITITEVKDPQ
jgi:hypothetical protein